MGLRENGGMEERELRPSLPPHPVIAFIRHQVFTCQLSLPIINKQRGEKGNEKDRNDDEDRGTEGKRRMDERRKRVRA